VTLLAGLLPALSASKVTPLEALRPSVGAISLKRMAGLGFWGGAAMIAEHLIEEVRSRADIVEIIGELLPLKRAGKDFRALCPFHHEKTPSFYVVPAKGFYKCFGCGEAGDVFSFLMKRSGYSFQDAVRELAAKVGVDIPDERRQEGEEPHLPLHGLRRHAPQSALRRHGRGHAGSHPQRPHDGHDGRRPRRPQGRGHRPETRAGDSKEITGLTEGRHVSTL